MNDLNERLAEWAEFHHIVGVFWRQPKGMYELKDGYAFDAVLRLPDFPNDLNACFKWLVPKIQPTDIHFKKTTSYPEHPLHEVNCWFYFQGKQYEGWSYDPAQALCNAIDKLIERAPKGDCP